MKNSVMKLMNYSVIVGLLLGLLGSCNQKPKIGETFSSIKINDTDTPEQIITKATQVVPTPQQYEALKDEYIAFIHFGPNTFSRREWGTGMEDPRVFDLHHLDTDQWCETIKASGMKKVILTVKHHDGFCLWQTRYTQHGIMNTPYKDGHGDILKELSASCQKYGLKLGVYLSPADLYQIENPKGLYGNLSKKTTRTIPKSVEGRPFENKTTFTFDQIDDYNEYFLNQLFELLTEYGPIHEVWFDGAHPKRKGNQQYQYKAWKKLIRTLAPETVIFGREDIRWCGNESGATRDTEWNIIPYPENPQTANHFPDLTDKDLGSREKLYKGKYLHYLVAETNTSIREGWFYRDETTQRVRSADDVFDIYERAVGGNSIFLLNIPPNRDGKFSDEDVTVLKEIGNRIKETYETNLFENASVIDELLDNDPNTYAIFKTQDTFEINLDAPVTINRLMLQEAITTHSERIEQHSVEVKINGQWIEIAKATNVGYKRILRFPQVTSDAFRVRILAARDEPALIGVAAFYYTARPPELMTHRNVNGMVSIMPKGNAFGWKPHGENSAENLNPNLKIHYTTDGNTPTLNSKKYEQPFAIAQTELNAIAFDQRDKGPLYTEIFGIIKKDWTAKADSQMKKHIPEMAFDENPKTYWQSSANKNTHQIIIDLKKSYSVKGFSYTPQQQNAEGMIENGKIQFSTDGKNWSKPLIFEFGNLINDPSKRTFYFDQTNIRYAKIQTIKIAGESTSASIAEIAFF